MSFGTNGQVVGAGSSTNPNRAIAVSIQRDGKLVVGGNCGASIGWSFCIARFNSDGSVDSGFGTAGRTVVKLDSSLNNSAGVALQADGQIVLAGSCGNKFCLARFQRGAYDAAQCALNLDANLTIDSATDALLTTRYLLGLRGTALTDGAVGPNPGRSNAEIEAYLADLLAQGKLDADGDGQTLAMTDGLLILRAMLGFSGDALTAGAVNATHPNVRNAQQILTWVESTHGVACLP